MEINVIAQIFTKLILRYKKNLEISEKTTEIIVFLIMFRNTLH